MAEEDDIILLDEETSRSVDIKFSHETLVMKSLNICIDKGSCEMTEGYNILVTDNKGKKKVVYHEDTRLAFIESVRILKSIMICDFDKKAKKNIKKLEDEERKCYEDRIKEQKEFFKANSRRIMQENKNIIIDSNSLNKRYPFYEFFLGDRLRIHREMLEELSKLTGRLGFYKSKDKINERH